MIWLWASLVVVPASTLLMGMELNEYHCIWIAIGIIGASFEISKRAKRERLVFKKGKTDSRSDVTYGIGGEITYTSGRLRRVADEKREYMYTMLRLLNEEKARLEKLEQSRESMSQDVFEREFKYQQYIVAQKEQYYHQAVEEYRAAELEAP